MHYYQFGPEATDCNPHWFDFPFDGTVGATVQPGQPDVLIQLKDGHVPGDSPAGLDFAMQITAALVYDNNVTLMPWDGDTDQDGITDQIENQARFDGDGNQDGTPDRLQGHVASFLDNRNGNLTLELLNRRSPLTQFASAGPFTVPVPERMSQHSAFHVEVVNALADSPLLINIIRPPTTGYLHYGREPNATYDHWFEFPFDGRVGAERSNLKMTLQLADNELGDEDSTVGTIGFAGAAGILSRLQIVQHAESYLDANRNGIRDEGEGTLAGQPIYVDENTNGTTYTLADQVGVWFGNGDGTFEFESSYNLDNSPENDLAPYAIRAADLSGDGYSDLVVANHAGFLSVLFGSADGSFLEPQSIPVGGQPGTEDLTIVDLDESNGRDIVVTNRFNESTTIFYNDGAGGFDTSTTLSVKGGAVTTGQFNTSLAGDDFLDLAIAQRDGVLILYGNEAGQFDLARSQRIHVPDGASGLTAINIDRDGHMDLATVGALSNKVTLLKQGVAKIDFILKSTLTPIATLDVGESPRYIVTDDLDGDTIPDLAVATNRGRTIDILRGNPYQQHIVHMAERPIGRNPNVSFGVFPLEAGSIEGRVWTDLDGDGIRDLNTPNCEDCAEPYRKGLIVYLDHNQNGRLDIRSEAFVRTDDEGRYRFLGLEQGVYQLRMDVELGAVQSYPEDELELELNRSQTVNGVEFGYAPAGRIEGTVFYDTNSNGQFDSGEEGLENWLVFIDEDNDDEFDEGEQSARTNRNGNYALHVSAGSYKVTQVIPAGWDDSLPVSVTVNQLDQTEHRTVNFANFPVNGSLSGLKWRDRNENGTYELEEGIPGVEVYVDLNHKGANDNEPSGITDANGRYQIDRVPVGNHVVRDFDAVHYENENNEPSFGFSAAANDDYVLIGAPSAIRRNTRGVAVRDGRVFLFDRITGTSLGQLDIGPSRAPEPVRPHLPAPGDPPDGFGYFVGLSDGWAAVSAALHPATHPRELGTGRTFLFDLESREVEHRISFRRGDPLPEPIFDTTIASVGNELLITIFLEPNGRGISVRPRAHVLGRKQRTWIRRGGC